MSKIADLNEYLQRLNAESDARILFEYGEGDAVQALSRALQTEEGAEELEQLFTALVLEGGERSPATLALLVYLFGDVEATP